MKNIKTYTDSLNEAEGQEVLDRKLLDAVKKGNTDLTKELLDRGANPNATSKNGQAAIHFASGYGRTDIVRLLIDKGAVVDVVSGYDNMTPLHSAVIGDYKDIVKLLLGAGADVNIGKNTTPLHNASQAATTGVAGLLLDRGANTNARDWSGNTPLHYAAISARKKNVDLLLQRGAEIDPENLIGWTPLRQVAYHRLKDIAKFLILRGANPFKAFDGSDEIMSFFGGDISWMPEGPFKDKLMRMQRGKRAFGM